MWAIKAVWHPGGLQVEIWLAGLLLKAGGNDADTA
jgi:hypothetical protein